MLIGTFVGIFKYCDICSLFSKQNSDKRTKAFSSLLKHLILWWQKQQHQNLGKQKNGPFNERQMRTMILQKKSVCFGQKAFVLGKKSTQWGFQFSSLSLSSTNALSKSPMDIQMCLSKCVLLIRGYPNVSFEWSNSIAYHIDNITTNVNNGMKFRTSNSISCNNNNNQHCWPSSGFTTRLVP